jgi:hypothetical protein
MNVPETFAPNVLDGGELKPELAAGRHPAVRVAGPLTSRTRPFNFATPVIGGFAKEKIALRRAMAMAYNVDEQIRVVRKGQAMHMQMPIRPVSLVTTPTLPQHHPRTTPDTAQPSCSITSATKRAPRLANAARRQAARSCSSRRSRASSSRELDEVWHKRCSSLGIKWKVKVAPLVDNIQAAKACKLADVGAGVDRRLSGRRQLHAALYGRTPDRAITAATSQKRSTKFYEKSRLIPDSPERNRLFSK